MPEKVSEDEAAYGLLWRMRTTDQRVHAARHALREKVGKEGQSRGITWARQAFGEMAELVAILTEIDKRIIFDGANGFDRAFQERVEAALRRAAPPLPTQDAIGEMEA